MTRPTEPDGDPGSLASARRFLRERKTRGPMLGLERMARFAAALGQPQDRLPCVHVAGTNGKGSVAAMLEAILRAAGWRTGLYTSPHLVQLGERVQVDRRPLSFAEIAQYVTELRPIVAQLEQGASEAGPSYFEFMTGLAFLHFARQACDVAVVEVGMGGRLDATNVVTPELSVITSIALDHCEVLGDSIEAIAAEKAGIIKPGRPVVIGRLPPEAERGVRKVAAERGSPVHSVREVFGDALTRYPRTNLAGEYQRWNAATAMLAAQNLGARWRLVPTVVEAALGDVDWSGRWQKLRIGDRDAIIDGSHNPEGAAVLDANLRQLVVRAGRRPIVVTGVLGARRAAAIMDVICRHAREVRLVVPAQPRACSIAQLESLVPRTFAGRVVPDTVAAAFPLPDTCRLGEPGDTIVVTGSIYLAGEVLARLRPQPGGLDADLQDF